MSELFSLEIMGLSFFDLCFIGVVLLFLCIGLARGFLREIGKLLAGLISLIGSKALSLYLEVEAYNRLNIDVKLREYVTEVVNKASLDSVEVGRQSLTDGLQSVPGVGAFIGDIVKNNWYITSVLQDKADDMRSRLVELIMEGLEPIAHQIMSVAVYIVAFIVVYFVLSLIFKALESAFDSLRIFGMANTLLGGLVGAAKGCIFVVLLFSIVFIALSVTGNPALEYLKDSKIFELVTGMGQFLPK